MIVIEASFVWEIGKGLIQDNFISSGEFKSQNELELNFEQKYILVKNTLNCSSIAR